MKDASICPKGTKKVKGKCVITTTSGHWYKQGDSIVLLNKEFDAIKTIKI